MGLPQNQPSELSALMTLSEDVRYKDKEFFNVFEPFRAIGKNFCFSTKQLQSLSSHKKIKGEADIGFNHL